MISKTYLPSRKQHGVKNKLKRYAQKVTLKDKEALLNDAILRPFEEKWYQNRCKKRGLCSI